MAKRRLIDSAKPFGPFGNQGYEAKIYHCAEFAEYSVVLYINGVKQKDSDYFTDDRTDAENTAIRMIGA